jgi:hypothetical protein
MGRAGEGWNPLQTGYLQYPMFALQRQEESETAARIRFTMQELSHFPQALVKSLQVLSSW